MLDYFERNSPKQRKEIWEDPNNPIKNRTCLYKTITELLKHDYLGIEKDETDSRRQIISLKTRTPGPIVAGWERFLLEPNFAKCRVAARLGLHLYYLCVNEFVGHLSRVQKLAEMLKVEEQVNAVVELSKKSSERERIELLRGVDLEIRERNGDIVGAAFSLSHWISYMTMQAEKIIDANLMESEVREKIVSEFLIIGRKQPYKRICDELETLTDNKPLVEYVRRNFRIWTDESIDTAKSIEDNFLRIYTQRITLFCTLLNLYVANFNKQHSQTYDVLGFFEKKLLINGLQGPKLHSQKYFVAEDPKYPSIFENSIKKILIRPLGEVSIVSGSGIFEKAASGKKLIEALPDQPLRGTITLKVTNKMLFSNIAPLVEIRTWLNHEEKGQGWQEIFRDIRDFQERIRKQTLPSGQNVDQVILPPIEINVKAPSQKGTHYLIYAFREETDCKYIASSTYWKLSYPVWNDKCDLANLTKEQIEQSQKYGHTEVLWLYEYGYGPADLPADAISIIVK
jgi:hypothetical protein